MPLPTVLQRSLPLAPSQTAAEIDAEICEELQFHLDMRAQDNLQAGMSPDEAHQDARQRFGDFDASRRACRSITLGPRIMLQRIQTGLLVAIVAAVAFQGVLLMNVQSSSQQQIEALTQMVQQLSADQPSAESTRSRASPAAMSNVHWGEEVLGESSLPQEVAPPVELTDWGARDSSTNHAWSDWQALDESAED